MKVSKKVSPLVKLVGVSKSFGSVQANRNANLEIREGEIHSLLGENGAGKSSLMNMLSGIYLPDSGRIIVNGEEVSITSPKRAFKLGISMIHQHFKLIPVMSAYENIILGTPGDIILSKKKLLKKIGGFCEKYGIEIDLNKKVYELSVGEKQTLEIIKVLYRGSKVIILDEPTAVLTPAEIKKLFSVMRKLAADGRAIVIITHKLGEVMEISDRVTVLRGGETIETVMTKDADINGLIEKMVGKKIDLKIFRENHAGKNEILKVSNLYFKSDDGKYLLKDLSFEVNSFEILGIAGISGNGQKELCETIAGLSQADSGKITLSDENILGKSPAVIMKKGIRLGFIPEDRLGMGLVSSMDIVHNVALKEYQKEKGHRLKTEGSKETAGKIVRKLDVKTPSLKTKIAKLSGGNIQKILLGREISAKPKVLITAYPARGLDIVASYKIYDLLNEQKKNGVAIIFIGEDLDVLLSISDRLMVMHEGQIAKILDPKKTTKEEVGLLMTGTENAGEVDAMAEIG